MSAGRSVDAALGDRDPVQGAVELAVAAAVEPGTAPLAGAGLERGDAGVAGGAGGVGGTPRRGELAEALCGAPPGPPPDGPPPPVPPPPLPRPPPPPP